MNLTEVLPGIQETNDHNLEDSIVLNFNTAQPTINSND